MACYADEDEVWKCAQHPSKRRRTGVCHLCLKDRLSALCPNCAALRPCSCSAATTTTTTTTSSSSSSSSSFSLQISDLHFNHNQRKPHHQRRISNLIDSEPPFQRSKSSAFPFFRSARFSDDKKASEIHEAGKASSFWSVFWWQKKGRREKENNIGEKLEMRRSRSVAASTESVISSSRSSMKGKAWYFPSPMKVFRHSSSNSNNNNHKASSQKVSVHERSPLHRG